MADNEFGIFDANKSYNLRQLMSHFGWKSERAAKRNLAGCPFRRVGTTPIFSGRILQRWFEEGSNEMFGEDEE